MTIIAGTKIKVVRRDTNNWYKLGEVYTASEPVFSYDSTDIKAWRVEEQTKAAYILIKHIEEVPVVPANKVWTDSHYDNYYELTKEDVLEGRVKLDTYLVAKVWKVGSKDDSGALWHSLKTINRFGQKNDVSREIQALYAQAKALARIYGVTLND